MKDRRGRLCCFPGEIADFRDLTLGLPKNEQLGMINWALGMNNEQFLILNS
jgi:hypothetical protein